MDLNQQLKTLQERIVSLKENIQTEEATKNAFILPFIQLLGYDVFNPLEVIPEFVADIGVKKGEKVDFAIAKGKLQHSFRNYVILSVDDFKEIITEIRH